MKQVISFAVGVLQLVLLAGIGVLLWLDKNSMGVMRYLSNKNRVWNQASWIGWFFIVAAIAVAALGIWACLRLSSPKTKESKGAWSLLALFGILGIWFIVIAKTATVRPYYFVCIILVIVTLLQAVKCVAAKRSPDKNR